VSPTPRPAATSHERDGRLSLSVPAVQEGAHRRRLWNIQAGAPAVAEPKPLTFTPISLMSMHEAFLHLKAPLLRGFAAGPLVWFHSINGHALHARSLRQAFRDPLCVAVGSRVVHYSIFFIFVSLNLCFPLPGCRAASETAFLTGSVPLSDFAEKRRYAPASSFFQFWRKLPGMNELLR